MKRKSFLPFFLGITLLFNTYGCGSDMNQSTTDTVTQENTQTIVADETESAPLNDDVELIPDNTLTQEKIDYFNEWIAKDVNCLFALSQYADISYLNFSLIANEFDGDMFTSKAVNEYLKETANITMEDLRFAYEPDSKTDNIYFSVHGDTNKVVLTCIGGYDFDIDGYTVWYSSLDGMVLCAMNFEKVGNRYVVCGNHLDMCPIIYCSQLDPDEFFLPHSDCSYVSEDELLGFPKEACRIARNEIYARHGLIFKDQELTDHFSQFDWYKPKYTSEEFGYDMLSSLEQTNVNTIVAYEKKMGYR